MPCTRVFAVRRTGPRERGRRGGPDPAPGRADGLRASAGPRGILSVVVREIFSGDRRGIFPGRRRKITGFNCGLISRTITENSIGLRFEFTPGRVGGRYHTTGPSRMTVHRATVGDAAVKIWGRAGRTPGSARRRSSKPWCCARGDVNLFVMSTSSADSRKVTYVTAALGLRLPLTRELCCRRYRG